jgi:hypothetical protein
MTNELPAPYVAASDTSHARAINEDLAGTTTKRRKQISDIVRAEFTQGMTWAELADATGLHHGQVSGALSKLHEMGRLFQRRDTRNGCHPYVHSDYRHEFDDNEVNDEPVKTRSTVLREAYEDLETAARNLLYSQAGGSAEKWNHLRNAVKQLEQLKND